MAFNFIAAAGFNFLKDMHSQSKARAEARRSARAADEAARIARQIPGGRSLGTAGNAGSFAGGRIFNPEGDTSEQPPISDQGFVPGLHTDFTPSVAESGAGDATQRFVEGGLGRGDVFVSGGIRYVYDGYEWLPQGDPLNAGQLQPSVEFMANAFADSIPSENDQPFPIWANGRRGTNPIAMNYHSGQGRRLLQVLAFVEIDSSLEIPLVGDDGESLLDPAVPPHYVARNRSSQHGDVIDDYNSVNRGFREQFCDTKGYVGAGLSGSADNNAEEPHYSVTFRLEKTPKPHWVCRIVYEWNKLTLGKGVGRTMMIHILGNFAGVSDNNVWETGTIDVLGHYEIKYFVATPQNFLRAGLVGTADDLDYYHYEDYIVAGASSVCYLSDDGTSGGTSAFDTIWMAPFVRLYGDHDTSVDRGTTEQNYKSVSTGIGVGIDGIWDGNEDTASAKRSIQNQQQDIFCAYSELSYDTTFNMWKVEVFNASGLNNVAGVARSSAPRHFTLHVIGGHA